MENSDKLDKYIQLLEANKNIILTGAPGTGKTHLAKAIAERMGAEYEFVQFHPSYDYTDFVEGLRPTPSDQNGNIGFERKDGVFKEFCKRVITNFVDEELTNTDVTLFEKCYYDLIEDIKNNKIESIQLKQKQSTQLSVTSNNSIKWHRRTIEENDSANSVSLNRLIKLYSAFKTLQEVEDMKNIDKTIRDIIGGANTTYYWGVLREVMQRKEEYNITRNTTSQLTSIDIKKYIKTDVDIKSSTGRTEYHINNIDDKYIYLNGASIKKEGYKIPIDDIIKAYNNRLWDGGQSNGYDSYTAALAKYVYEKINIVNPQNVLVESGFLYDNKKYIFIIDEINRGEISKIFGELFFSIDPDYRGERGLVKTQYQNLITNESDPFYEGFYVPENVYIIGTMNDIDRSVESMDFAMRRRFAWIEVKANENTGMLDEKLSDIKDEIINIMKRLNTAIWDEDNDTGIEGLSAAYHIGGSYFSKLSLYLNKEHTNKQEAYENLWNNHLKGVLFEYLRGTINAMENLKMLEQVYFNQDIYGTEG